MDTLEEETGKILELLTNSVFEIAGDDQLTQLRKECENPPESEEERRRLTGIYNRFLRNIKVRMGTLLKTDHLSFLFGAGASKDAGGVLLGKVPLEVEQTLLYRGIQGARVGRWLNVFYLAAQSLASNPAVVPHDREGILRRKATVGHGVAEEEKARRSASQIAVGFEDLLSLLYRWNDVLTEFDTRLRIDGKTAVAVTKQHLERCLTETMAAFVNTCSLPRRVELVVALSPFNNFLKKVLTRPLNLRRTALFTLNYDVLVEKAADANGVVLLDGFVGTERRVFRPEAYDHDLYFLGDTTEGRVHRLDRVIHLYKLHGSINWVSENSTWDNPYGVSVQEHPAEGSRILIYPTPAKYGEALGMPYAEMFRRFAASVVRPQSTLVVIGYGFGDPHVNTIIRQALAIPSFTLVVVDPFPPDPDPKSEKFVARLRARRDGRLWVLGGMTFGTFKGYVEHVLPDLHDEQVLSKVTATHRALGHNADSPPDPGGENGK
jgi:hypothetical protein